MVSRRRLLECALAALEDVFYVYDADGRLVEWNQSLNDIFGLTDEELIGMTPVDFFVANDSERVEGAVAELFETGSTVVEAWADTEQGQLLFELTGNLLTDGEGEPLGFSGIGRDVTTARERRWQLERQNERLGEFADVMSHDIRNPLQVATTHVDIERDERDSGSLAAAAEALARIGEIVDDVLTVAQTGQVVVDPEPVDLGAVAVTAWEAVATPNSTLDVRTTATVPGDSERLGRLFENLFRNAVEHGSTGRQTAADDSERDGPSDPGGVQVTVMDTDSGFVVVDDGVGVPESERTAVFEPRRSGNEEGTGFGLTIVRNIAEAHGWTVSLGEGEEGGARFEFRTPSVRSGGDVSLGPGDERGE